MRLFTLSIMILLSSCAGNYKMDYKEPTQVTSQNSVLVNGSLSGIWKTLSTRLIANGFTIDSTDKASGIMVVSKKLQPPQKYADCGLWSGVAKNNLGLNEEYNFNGAESKKYVSDEGISVYVDNVDKVTSLNTRSNIILTQKASNKVLVEVNINFKLNVEKTLVNRVEGDVTKDSYSIEWTSLEIGSSGNKIEKCVSNFELEKNILSYVK